MKDFAVRGASMMRVTRLTLIGMAMWVAGIGVAQAQTGEIGRFYAAVGAGATFGNQASSSSFSGEVGGRVLDQIEVFVEGGRMKNVATETLAQRAGIVANFIRGSATTQQKANFIDVGVR